MRFVSNAATEPAGRRSRAGLVLGALMCAACAGSSGNPSAPGQTGGYRGTWTGAIVSDAIGPGEITVVITSQLGPEASPLLSGDWSLMFADPTFSGRGLVAGNFNVELTILTLFFDRGPVPCPAAPGGVAQRSMIANLTVSGGTMRGNYLAAECPGGSMQLSRR